MSTERKEQWSREPWTIKQNPFGLLFVQDGDGFDVCKLNPENDIANAARIVACVNWCAGTQPGEMIGTAQGQFANMGKGFREVQSQLQTAQQTIQSLEEEGKLANVLLLKSMMRVHELANERDHLKSDLAKVTTERDEAKADRGQLAAQRIGEMGRRQIAEQDLATLRTKLEALVSDFRESAILGDGVQYAEMADELQSILQSSTPPADKWISVKENPPQEDDEQTCYFVSQIETRETNYCYLTSLDGVTYWKEPHGRAYPLDEYSHWQPLPPPPQIQPEK